MEPFQQAGKGRDKELTAGNDEGDSQLSKAVTAIGIQRWEYHDDRTLEVCVQELLVFDDLGERGITLDGLRFRQQQVLIHPGPLYELVIQGKEGG